MRIDESAFLQEGDVKLLEPAQVIAYLESRSWVQRSTAARSFAKVFYRADDRLAEVTVPLELDVSNYVNLIARSVYVISQYERRSQEEVYSDILFFSEDVVVFREISFDTANGTVALDRASSMLVGIRKSLLSVTHLEIDARPYYPSQNWVDAENFMDRCRFGQTKRSSYVMTVTCPLNAVPFQPDMDSATLFEPAFTRRVTFRLMSSMNRLVTAAEHDSIDTVIATDDKFLMLSSNLCDAILELAPSTPGSRLDMSVRWARKQPVDSEREPPTVVTLKPNHIPFIEAVSIRLKAAVLPDNMQTFSGRVDTLSGRAGPSGRMEGLVFSRLMDEEGDVRKVRIDLKPDDYQLAIDAHRENKLVMVRGHLRRASGGGLRIEQYREFEIVTSQANQQS